MAQLTSTTPPLATAANNTEDALAAQVLSEGDLALHPTDFPFMNLPKDLRLMVYDIVATHTTCRPLRTPRHGLYYDVPDLGLLCTSRSIRDEAFSILRRGDNSAIPTLTIQPSLETNEYDMKEPMKNAKRVLERLRTGMCACCREKDDKLVSCPKVYQHRAMTETGIIDFVYHTRPHLVCTESTINQFYHRTFAAFCKDKLLPVRVVLPFVENPYIFIRNQLNWLFMDDIESLQQLLHRKAVRFVLLVRSNTAERWAKKLSTANKLPKHLEDGIWQVETHLWIIGFVSLEVDEREDLSQVARKSLERHSIWS